MAPCPESDRHQPSLRRQLLPAGPGALMALAILLFKLWIPGLALAQAEPSAESADRPDIALWGWLEPNRGLNAGETAEVVIQVAHLNPGADPLPDPILTAVIPPTWEYLAGSWRWTGGNTPRPETVTAVPLPGERGTRIQWRWRPPGDGSPAEWEGQMRFQIRSAEGGSAGPQMMILLAAPGSSNFTCWGESPTSSVDTITGESPACLFSLDAGLQPAQAQASSRPSHLVSLGLIPGGKPENHPGPAASGRTPGLRHEGEAVFWGNDGVGIPGAENEVVVVLVNRQAAAQRLSGWIDFNRDGVFSPEERIIAGRHFGRRTNPQAARVTFHIPAAAACGATWARFLLEPAAAGGAPAGPQEIEETPYQIECQADLTLTAVPSSSPIGRDETLHWILTVTNEGPSAAEQILLTDEFGPGLGFLGLEVSDNRWSCSPPGEIISTNRLDCRYPTLAAGQTITVDLALVVPRNYAADTIPNTARVASDTLERDLSQNYRRSIVELEKRWVLGNYRPVHDFPFIHVGFHPAFIRNPDLREQDFRVLTTIPNHIQVPISIAVGYSASTRPWLTVPSCTTNPEDPTCNSNNRIDGLVLVESYALNRITYENEWVVYAPERPLVRYLNRVADSNLSRCAGAGSCIGFDLFRVEKGGVKPYDWDEPADYFYLNFITRGGREISCPTGIPAGQCVIVNEARPGTYQVHATLQLIVVFDDRRLGDEPMTLRLAPYPVTANLQILAPFTEPEPTPTP